MLSRANSDQTARLYGFPVSTAIRGRVITVQYGTGRVAPNLIWTGGWNAQPAGSKSKNKVGSNTNYTYYTDLIMALCHGPINGVGQLWFNNVRYATSGGGSQVEIYTVPGGGGTYTPTFSNQTFLDAGVYVINAFSVSVNDYGSPGSTTLAGNQNVPYTSVNGGQVVGVVMLGGGYYASPPTVTFVGGGGTGATGTVVMDGTGHIVNSVTITASGSGYTSAPTVVFTGGNPTEPAVGTAALNSPGSLGPGQYYFDALNGTYTFGAASGGTTVQIAYIWNPVALNGITPADGVGFAIITGDLGQAPWTFLNTLDSSGNPLFPGQALGYTEVALACAGGVGYQNQFTLGSSGTLPNMSFEVFGFGIWGANVLDAPIFVPTGAAPQLQSALAGVIPDVLTNPLWGAGLYAFELGDLTDLGNYTIANGIFISPGFDHQESALSHLAPIMKAANGEGFWSEGVLKFRTYGDTSAVGNGVQFTPQTNPIYDLDVDDFISKEGEEPILIERPTVRDAPNRWTVEWANRGNFYNLEPLPEDDDWSIGNYGLNPASPMHLPFVTTQPVAQTVVNIAKNRGVYIRNTHKFKLSVAYCLLEPMDLVTVTDPFIYMANQTPVRILSIEEDDKMQLEFECEDFPWGTAKPTLHPKQVSSTFGPGYYANPGSVNTPYFFEPPVEVTQGNEYVVGIALSGPTNWGGSDCYVSTDGGTTYTFIGRQSGPSTMGVLTAVLPAVQDPDTSSTLAVNLGESFGVLDDFTVQEENAFVPICFVDDEAIAYENAALTATASYNITNMRRAVYDTTLGTHAIGAPFAYMGQNNSGNIFLWQYGKQNVEHTLYFKFTAFNQAGQREQSIADVTAFAYTPLGPRVPYIWATASANVAPGDQLYLAGTIWGMEQLYNTLSDGSIQAQLQITGYTQVNSFSLVTRAPLVTLTSSSTGGSIPGGITVYIGVYAIDTGREDTPMTIVSIDVPSGTNTNSITVLIALYNPTTDAAQINISLNPEQGWAAGPSVAPGASGSQFNVPGFGTQQFGANPNPSMDGVTELVTSLGIIPRQVPDPNAYSYLVEASEELHAGIWGGTINNIVSNGDGTCTVTVTGSTWTVDQLANRIFSLLMTSNPGPMPVVNVLINSNTADTITLAKDLVLPFQFVYPNDVCTIRTKATIYSANQIGDANFVNGGAGQAGTGLAVNQDVGNLIFIIKGTGAFQPPVTIAGNTNTTYTITTPFAVTPDSTSVFIVTSPTVTQGPIRALSSPNFLNLITLSVNPPNKIQKTYFVQTFILDEDGNMSLQQFTPFREIYQPGQAWASRLIEDSSTQILSDQILNFDTTLGPIVFQMLPFSQFLGRRLFWKKTSTDTNTLTFSCQGSDTIDGNPTLVVGATGGTSGTIVGSN